MAQHSELQSLVRGPASDAKANLNPISSYLEMAQHPVLSDPVSLHMGQWLSPRNMCLNLTQDTYHMMVLQEHEQLEEVRPRGGTCSLQ